MMAMTKLTDRGRGQLYSTAPCELSITLHGPQGATEYR